VRFLPFLAPGGIFGRAGEVGRRKRRAVVSLFDILLEEQLKQAM
jgi:hypothetical protein